MCFFIFWIKLTSINEYDQEVAAVCLLENFVLCLITCVPLFYFFSQHFSKCYTITLLEQAKIFSAMGRVENFFIIIMANNFRATGEMFLSCDAATCRQVWFNLFCLTSVFVHRCAMTNFEESLPLSACLLRAKCHLTVDQRLLSMSTNTSHQAATPQPQ